MKKKRSRGKRKASKKQEETRDALIITKALRITGVRVSWISNAPFCIVLESTADFDGIKDGGEMENILIMDEPTARHQGIPLTFTVVGKKLVCTFVCVPYAPTITPCNNMLSVESLSKEERVVPFYTPCPPASRSKIRRALSIKTPETGILYGHSSPCPFYRIAFATSEEEYRACKNFFLAQHLKFIFNYKRRGKQKDDLMGRLFVLYFAVCFFQLCNTVLFKSLKECINIALIPPEHMVRQRKKEFSFDLFYCALPLGSIQHEQISLREFLHYNKKFLRVFKNILIRIFPHIFSDERPDDDLCCIIRHAARISHCDRKMLCETSFIHHLVMKLLP